MTGAMPGDTYIFVVDDWITQNPAIEPYVVA